VLPRFDSFVAHARACLCVSALFVCECVYVSVCVCRLVSLGAFFFLPNQSNTRVVESERVIERVDNVRHTAIVCYTWIVDG